MSLLDYSREEFVGKELWQIGLFKDIEASSTTVVDRRLVTGSRVSGSGSESHGIGVVFAIGTSGAGGQRRAIRAIADG